jgi:hypothetical protein
MKKIFTFCFAAVLLFLSSCRQDCPRTLSEKYMALICVHDEVHNALHVVQCNKEQTKLQTRIDKIHDQLEKLNARILAKFQGCEHSMEIIQEVTANYQCK